MALSELMPNNLDHRPVLKLSRWHSLFFAGALSLQSGVPVCVNADEVAAQSPREEDNIAAEKDLRPQAMPDRALLEFLAEFNDVDVSTFELLVQQELEGEGEEFRGDEDEGHEN